MIRKTHYLFPYKGYFYLFLKPIYEAIGYFYTAVQKKDSEDQFQEENLASRLHFSV